MTKTKIALVTGGSRGLGKDMALSLANKGIYVILTYHTNKDEAENVVSEILKSNRKAAAMQLDVSEIKSFDNFVSQVLSTLQSNWNTDKFDYLINSAGVGATIPIAEVTEEVFDNLLNIHLKVVYFLTQKCMSHVNDKGGIIYIIRYYSFLCSWLFSLFIIERSC